MRTHRHAIREATAAPVAPVARWAMALTVLLAAACSPSPGSEAEAAPSGETAGEETAMEASDDLEGRVVLVTGSTSGLGREVARRLGERGARVLVHGRDRERGMEVVRAIQDGAGSARFYQADLASFDDVRQLAESVLEEHDRLDILVNNAGIGSSTPDTRVITDDGWELRLQVNYLSHYLLTRLLLPRLRESAPSRIVNVSSLAQTPIDFSDPNMDEGYSGSRAYAQSKLAQVLFTVDLADELEGTGVVVNSLHPATYMDTKMVRQAGVEPRSTVDEGADAVMQLVLDDVGSGGFYDGLEEARADDQAYDEEERARLRELSRDATGLDGQGGS